LLQSTKHASRSESRWVTQEQRPVHERQPPDARAVGQYDIYRSILAETGSDRLLFLAVPEHVSEGILAERLGQLIVTRLQLRLIVFDVQRERIVRWTR
jgi:hypothetical protein